MKKYIYEYKAYKLAGKFMRKTAPKILLGLAVLAVLYWAFSHAIVRPWGSNVQLLDYTYVCEDSRLPVRPAEVYGTPDGLVLIAKNSLGIWYVKSKDSWVLWLPNVWNSETYYYLTYDLPPGGYTPDYEALPKGIIAKHKSGEKFEYFHVSSQYTLSYISWEHGDVDLQDISNKTQKALFGDWGPRVDPNGKY